MGQRLAGLIRLRLPITANTISVHVALFHIPEIIELTGPLSITDEWALERLIGVLASSYENPKNKCVRYMFLFRCSCVCVCVCVCVCWIGVRVFVFRR
jgi:hypothetical protein